MGEQRRYTQVNEHTIKLKMGEGQKPSLAMELAADVHSLPEPGSHPLENGCPLLHASLSDYGFQPLTWTPMK